MPLNLKKFLESGELADVEFVVKSEKFGTSKTFKAHKQLLALSSEVFKAMFYGQLAEKDTVVITDLHPDGFYGLLKYVYAGRARIENCFEALHTNAAAEKYLLEELASACLTYLRKHVDAKEACLLLDCAFESGYGSLDKVAEAVLGSVDEAVLSSDAFLSSRLETVHLVLDKVRNVREIFIIRAALRRARSYCKSGAMDFKATIAAFLPKLRFLALLPPEFVELITSEDAQGVMEKEDAFTILCNLIHKGRTDLPEWVCREDVNRLAILSDIVCSGSSTRLGTLSCLLGSEYSSSSEYDYDSSDFYCNDSF
ncbi:BTB/POZ domain-containing protein 6-B-like isoform X1 [Dermacentor andersoni]|uniref:BTB/POZ domain-containing protein 6-B-like isoform X1 n=1 Tax=Dermacentor andersoni TaxID=34620 RepID=UPI002416DEF5|nr:BTB/POZ domain-containing protein 6-B-like isoform X1 [Dermacentor andersoni]XP_054928452.1 BTB/POZ domain-containing protein 6-B-like isoform X1 [Dermacentor andersoni]XP_054928453.1 BTB/POZ domain-containing protein 6-B-like isoform X1 [Dermacentor andersoni]